MTTPGTLPDDRRAAASLLLAVLDHGPAEITAVLDEAHAQAVSRRG